MEEEFQFVQNFIGSPIWKFREFGGLNSRRSG